MNQSLIDCLDSYYDEGEINPFDALNINSKYYHIDDINSTEHNNTNFKYTALHINIQGLASSFDKLKSLILHLENNNMKLDFILICETFLDGKQVHLNYENLFNIPGYSFIHKSRTSKTKGGVAIYVHKSYKFELISNVAVHQEGEFESLVIKVKNKHNQAIVGEIYRVPNTNEQISIDRYESSITKLKELNINDIIIGTDQNFDYLKINESNSISDLLNMHISNGILPVITQPTRITHTTATLIDNLYVALNHFDKIESGIIVTDISDHLPIYVFVGTCKKEKPNPTVIETRDLSENKVKDIEHRLNLVNWEALHNKHPEESYNDLINEIQFNLNMVSPLRKFKISTKKIIRDPWITPGLLKCSSKCDKMYKKCLGKAKTHPMYIKYTQYRNVYNRTKRYAKKTYFKVQLDNFKTDIRKTWSILRSAISRQNDKSNISDYFTVNGVNITNPKIIANEFCKYFSNIGPCLSENIGMADKSFEMYLKQQENPELRRYRSFYLNPTDPYEVHKIINGLKPKKSQGNDNISVWLLKKLINPLSLPISLIINKSLQMGYIPQALKIAKVIPIYKAKEKHSFGNYRPISILPAISKVLEKVVYSRLYAYINNFLFKSQYGFRSKHSTTHAVTELYLNILDSLEKKKYCLSSFLDLSKAFDTINHDILLHKLEFYGVRGLALNWFKNYLSHREQYVSYNNNISQNLHISCGVPQGSVLGPLLFLIYVNDLPSSLKYLNAILFADDTTIFYSSPNPHELFNKTNLDLSILNDWFKSNKLSLNVDKTFYMVFSNRQTDINSRIMIGDAVIKQVSNFKFLGIYIDDKITWKTHTQNCKNKIASSLYAINSVKNILPLEHLSILYSSLVKPYIEYGLLLWGGTFKTHLKPIAINQRKCLRAITHSNYYSDTRPIFSKIKQLPLNELYKLHLGKFMYQYYRQDLPPKLNNIFTLNNEVHNYNTRHAVDPHISANRTVRTTHSLVLQGPNLWYSLPSSIKESRTPKSFVTNLKRFLLEHM